MIIVTVKPWSDLTETLDNDFLKQIQVHYPQTVAQRRETDQERFALLISQTTWRKEDRDFFDGLVAKKLLAGWAIIGGSPGH